MRALDWKLLIYFTAIWSILQKFGKFYDPFVHFVFIWYIFSGLGILYREKSGNPCRRLSFVCLIQGMHPSCISPVLETVETEKNKKWKWTIEV
jgi:hypothetical protein